MSVCVADPLAVQEYVRSHGYHPTMAFCVRDVPEPKKAKLLGPIPQIEYLSMKDFEGPKQFTFWHAFRGVKKPWLAVGSVGRLDRFFVLGGGYTVKPHGIIDDPSDPRDLPEDRGGRFAMDARIPASVTGMGEMDCIFYLDENDKRQRVDYLPSSTILAYNYEGAVKTLYMVPVSNAQRTPLNR